MANTARFAADCAAIKPRHGKKEYVRIGADISPDVKDRLVAQSQRHDVPLVGIIRDALDFYLDAVEST